jgi:hypothetical protein
MRQILLLISCSILLSACESSTKVAIGDPWLRAATALSGGGATFKGIDSSSAGHAVSVGTIDGGATVNLSTSISYQGKFASGPSLLIASYSFYSDIVWASVPEVAPNESAFNSVAMDDRFRNAYAGGYIVDNQEFTLNNGIKATGGVASVRNALVVKYDVDGAARWAKTIVSGQSDSEILAIAIDSDQSVYAAGYFSGNSSAYNFGNGVTLTGLNAGYNPFLIKYDIDGNAVWAKTLTTAPDQSKFLSIVVDSSKNIYVGGYLTNAGTYNFGNSVTVAGAAGSGRANAVLVKYNSSGVAQWAAWETEIIQKTPRAKWYFRRFRFMDRKA